MINITLMGGLCNTMFQYALGRSLQERGKHITFRKQDLLPASSEPHSLNKPQFGLDLLKTNLQFGQKIEPEFGEPSMAFNPSIFQMDNCTLTGHWQSEKYFLDIADKIRQELQPLHLPSKELSNRMLVGNTVGIHVRRGDYVGLQHYHGLMTKEYYTDSLQYVLKNVKTERVPALKVFIFSDDPEWCRKEMPYGEVIETGDRFQDLYLMSLCQHVIISNSTFGWWAAWLGDNRLNRTVVAPRNWFNVQHLDSRDIIPDRWHLMGKPVQDKCIVTVGQGARQDVGKHGEQELIGQSFSSNLDRWADSFARQSPDSRRIVYRDVLPNNSPTHLENPYAFKVYAIEQAVRHGYDRVLWADSSVIAIRNLEPIWELISKQGYWFSKNGPNTCGEWTSDACLDILKLTKREAFKIPQIIGTAFGLDFKNPTAVAFFQKYKEYARLGAFKGPWTNHNKEASPDPFVLGHRHDQTVASVIAYRLNMKVMQEPFAFMANEPMLEVIDDYKNAVFFIERNGKSISEIKTLHPPYLETSLTGTGWQEPPLKQTQKMSDEELRNRQESARKFRESRRR